MRITSVKTHVLRYKLDRKLGGSHYDYSARDFLLIRVTTDEGLTGWGETALFGGVRSLIQDDIGPRLVGEDPRNHRRLWQKMWGWNFGNGMAVGGLDIALDDLRGQATGQSVAELHGGRQRDRVPVYASAMAYMEGLDPRESYPAEAKELKARGLKAMKMRIGRQPIAKDMAAVAAVREAVGPDIKLMADGNAGYTLATAVKVGKELERLGLYWFEEPLPEANYAGYDALRQKLDIALAGGECLNSRGDGRELIARRTVDVIQPDVTLCGGITECLFIGEMAALWGMTCNPHCYGSPIAITATLHALSVLPEPNLSYTPDVPMVEFDMSPSPLMDRLLVEPLRIVDGHLAVPTTPGLGIRINEDVLHEFEVR